jgi:hypothetical protein
MFSGTNNNIYILTITPVTLSVLGDMAAIVMRPFSGNFTMSETHAVKNSEEVLNPF